jgi:hypothetical protein
MGVCASCLGLAQPESQSDVSYNLPNASCSCSVCNLSLLLTNSLFQPSDSTHLLGDPYPPNQYGSLSADQRNGPQVDPEEIRKQRDALERLCAQTTEYESLPSLSYLSLSLLGGRFGYGKAHIGLTPLDQQINRRHTNRQHHRRIWHKDRKRLLQTLPQPLCPFRPRT